MNVEELLIEKDIEYTSKGKDFIVRCLSKDHDDHNPSMRIDKERIQEKNQKDLKPHQEKFDFLSNYLLKDGHDVVEIINKLSKFQVAIFLGMYPKIMRQ